MAAASSSAAMGRCDKKGDDGRPPATPTSPPSSAPSRPPPWRHVATAFVSFSPEGCLSPPSYALVKRSESVSTYRGLWGAVSGFIEAGIDASAAERAATEVEEEVVLDRGCLKLECCGRPLKVDDGPGRRFVVHPVRFRYCRPRERGDEGGGRGGEGDDGRRGDDRSSVEKLSSLPLLPPLLTTNWESSEAAWVPEEAFLQRETVPRLLDALRRTMPPPLPSPSPSLSSSSLAALPPLCRQQRFSRSSAAVSSAVAELVADRARGASQLAGVALRGLRDAAAAAAEEAAAAVSEETAGGDRSGEKEAEAHAAAWELCADWGFALAASRPAMAPLATSVAAALARAAASDESSEHGDDAEGGAAVAAPPSPPPAPPLAVFGAVARAAAEEEARLAEASKELVSAGVVVLRAALSRWHLRRRQGEDQEQGRLRRQGQGQGQGQRPRGRERRGEGQPPVPRIVTISFSSVVRDTLVALIKEVTASGAGELEEEEEEAKQRASRSPPPPPSPPPSPPQPPRSQPSRPLSRPVLRICVCEGRPLCEGARLAEELADEASGAAASLTASGGGGGHPPAVEVELCTDAAGPALVRGEGRSGGGGAFCAAAAVVLGADAVFPEPSSSSPSSPAPPRSVLFGVVNKVGSRALVEAAAGAALPEGGSEGAVPAFALAGRSKVAGGAGGVAALAAARSGCRPPLGEENDGDELMLEGRVRKETAKGTALLLRNPYFECVPLRLLEASGGGVVVESATGGGRGGDRKGGGGGDAASSPPSSSVTLLAARDVADLAERADERARAAFRMDWL